MRQRPESFRSNRQVDYIAAADSDVPTPFDTRYPFFQELPAQFLPTLHARALPGGPVSPEAYETLRDDLLTKLKALGPVDGVYLDLHGTTRKSYVLVGQLYNCGAVIQYIRLNAQNSFVNDRALLQHCHTEMDDLQCMIQKSVMQNFQFQSLSTH